MIKISLCAVALMLTLSVGYGQDMGGGMGAEPAKQDGGAITGTINLDGKAPKRGKVREIASNDFCSTQHKGTVWAEDLIVDEKNGNVIQNVFVYVKGVKAPATGEATLDQKGCLYTPHVIGVVTGQKLKITTSDATAHNISLTAKVNKGFNEQQGPGGAPLEKTFNSFELNMAASCQIHGWMKAVVHVVDNPYFAVSGADGKFSIKLPPGEYELEAVHETLGTLPAVKVKVDAKGATQNFTFKAP